MGRANQAKGEAIQDERYARAAASFGPAMERLSRAYFLAACRRLGWEVAPGQRHHTDHLLARLRIVPQYHRLFHSFLRDLERILELVVRGLQGPQRR